MSEDPASTRLHLVRHCDVRNPDGVLYGHLPDFPLSEKGVKQAHALGRFFARTKARQIYSSPLERARQTSEIIASHLNSASITYTDDLIETRFGLYLQGVPPKQVPWRRPLWLIHMVLPGLLSNDECVDALAARVRRPLMRLLADHPGEGGICVSHGDPIQGFWVTAEHRPKYALHRLQCAKGGLLELDYEGEELRRLAYLPPARMAELAPRTRSNRGGFSFGRLRLAARVRRPAAIQGDRLASLPLASLEERAQVELGEQPGHDQDERGVDEQHALVVVDLEERVLRDRREGDREIDGLAVLACRSAAAGSGRA